MTGDGPQEMPLPEEVETTGKVPVDVYAEMLGKSKVLLGIGRPPISPSVWVGL